MLNSRVDGASRIQGYQYDEHQRLTNRTFIPAADGSANSTYTYHGSSDAEFGLLEQVTSSIASYDYSYDPTYGRLESLTQTTAGLSFTNTYDYDELGRLTWRMFPDGEAFDYAYSGARLDTIIGASGNAVWNRDVAVVPEYDSLGRVVRMELGEKDALGSQSATLEYEFDTVTGRLSRILGTPGDPVSDVDADNVADSVDNCEYTSNSGQEDDGGWQGTPDTVGNACQCGDFSGDGNVTFNEDGVALFMHVFMGGPAPANDLLCDHYRFGGEPNPCGQDDWYWWINTMQGVSPPPVYVAPDGYECLARRPENVDLPPSQPLDLDVDFDGLGRLVDMQGSTGPETLDRQFTYDGLGRLETASGPWRTELGDLTKHTWTYSYDPLGNLAKRERSGVTEVAWSYDHVTKPRFLTSFDPTQDGTGSPLETIVADTGGNPTTIDMGAGPETLIWNAQNRMRSYKGSEYSYDTFDSKVLTEIGTTTIIHVGSDFEYLVDSGGAGTANKTFSINGTTVASLGTLYSADVAGTSGLLGVPIDWLRPYIAPMALGLIAFSLLSLLGMAVAPEFLPRLAPWPGVGLLAFTLIAYPIPVQATPTSGSGASAYGMHEESFLALLTDHLGSVRSVVNRNGQVIEVRDYLPFGGTLERGGIMPIAPRFTGQLERDEAHGLYDYGARMFNPKWGRFVSPDEFVEGFEPQGLNPYSYVRNQPTSLIDPNGRSATEIGGAVLKVIYGFGGVVKSASGPTPTRTEAGLKILRFAFYLVLTAALLTATTPAWLVTVAALGLTYSFVSTVTTVARWGLSELGTREVRVMVEPSLIELEEKGFDLVGFSQEHSAFKEGKVTRVDFEDNGDVTYHYSNHASVQVPGGSFLDEALVKSVEEGGETTMTELEAIYKEATTGHLGPEPGFGRAGGGGGPGTSGNNARAVTWYYYMTGVWPR